MRNLFADPIVGLGAWQAVLAGALCGPVGVHVLLRRLSFFVVALGHATLPGVALAAAMGVSLLAGGLAAGLLVAVAVTLVGRFASVDETSAVGVVLAAAFAAGVLIAGAGAGPSTGRSLPDYLVGSLLTTDTGEVVATVGVCAAAAAILLGAHKELVLFAFDRDAAEAAGYRAWAVDLLLLAVVAVAVVAAMPSIGLLLVAALLTVPALCARLLVTGIPSAMGLASAIGAACAYAGLIVSYEWDIAAGAAIAVTATALFCVVFLARQSIARR